MAFDAVFCLLLENLLLEFFVFNGDFRKGQLEVIDLRTHWLENVVLDFNMMATLLLLLHDVAFIDIKSWKFIWFVVK